MLFTKATQPKTRYTGVYLQKKYACDYWWTTECSRGKAKIYPIPVLDGSTVVGRKWSWLVFVKPTYDTKSEYIRYQGESKTLYKAAQNVLQRLFSSSRIPVYKLLQKLADDQVIYALAGGDTK